MIRKALLVEEIDSTQIWVCSTLRDALGITIDHSRDCDNAFRKLKKALQEEDPYDLLITDLSFKGLPGNSYVASGNELLKLAKGLQPALLTLIYSAEDRPYELLNYVKYLKVNGYVLKNPESAPQMIEAIQTIGNNRTYISPELSLVLKQITSLEVEPYDLILLRELANGYSQREISGRLHKKGMSPSSLSSIEKRINWLKDYFMARNIPHLISITKGEGLF